jgi:hypothetical protein
MLGAGLWYSRTSAQTPAAGATDAVPLVAGCNNIATTWDAGTPVMTVAGAITPAPALESIWRLDNAQQKYFGFSPLSSASANMANDYNTVLVLFEPVYVCMREAGTINRPRR